MRIDFLKKLEQAKETEQLLFEQLKEYEREGKRDLDRLQRLYDWCNEARDDRALWQRAAERAGYR